MFYSSVLFTGYFSDPGKAVVVVVCPVTGWRRGVVVSGVRRMNEVNARRARLVA